MFEVVEVSHCVSKIDQTMIPLIFPYSELIYLYLMVPL